MKLSRQAAAPYCIAVIALISCSMLMYEILLTRICALRLLFHFNFLVVSNALLGIGASGSLIFIFQERLARRERGFIFLSCGAYLVSVLVAYFSMLELQIYPGIQFVDSDGGILVRRILEFIAFNLVATIPFFFGGATVGMILTFESQDVNRVYGADLLGAGLGCLASPFLLWSFGAGGCLGVVLILGLFALASAGSGGKRFWIQGMSALLALAVLISIPQWDRWFPIPSKLSIRITENHQVVLEEKTVSSRWSAISRIDLFRLLPVERMLFGQGKKRIPQHLLPEQMLITQDGSASTYIGNFSGRPKLQALLHNTLYSLPASLKTSPSVFIIGTGGGNDVWGARVAGARSIKSVELNEQVMSIHEETLRSYSRELLEDDSIEFVVAEGRTAILKERQRYDVVQMTGIDTFTSLTSGAYMLAENYLYTVESMEGMINLLEEGGVLQISRSALEMETLRMLANLNAAHENLGGVDFQGSVACVSAYPMMSVIYKKGSFSKEEIQKVRGFVKRTGAGLHYLPDGAPPGRIPRFIRTQDKEAFIKAFPRNITPTSDDQPYFFNFTRWNDWVGASKQIDEPSQISQGNPLFIFGQLGLSLGLCLVLILGPLAFSKKRRESGKYFLPLLVYFSGVGLGFIGVEIVLIQKLVLFLGHPLYSITVTLFALLVFTGMGSMISERWFHSPGMQALWVPGFIALSTAIFTLGYPILVDSFVHLGTPARIAITLVLLAPLGFVLGIPFALGIRLVNRWNAPAVPWAWAVNACATVVGSILTVIVSMNFGFNWVLVLAVAIYTGAFFTIRPLMRAA